MTPRRLGFLFGCWLVFAMAAPPCRATLICKVQLKASGATLYSNGSVQYLDYWGYQAQVRITGSHYIVQPSTVTPTLAEQTIESTTGYWSNTLTAPGSVGACYRSTVNAYAEGTSQTVSSSRICIPLPSTQPPPSNCKEPAADGTCPPTGTTCLPEDTTCQLSPIILNLGHGAYDLTGTDDPVDFDLDADGQADRVAWTAPGASMAFLAFDRNGNGAIDDGSELFGDAAPLRDGGKAMNGFETLRSYDGNGDGIIDSGDLIWTGLLLWIDANHDGRSQTSELSTLSAAGVSALDTHCHWTGRRDRSGNTFRYEALVRRGGHAAAYYDVFFSRLGN